MSLSVLAEISRGGSTMAGSRTSKSGLSSLLRAQGTIREEQVQEFALGCPELFGDRRLGHVQQFGDVATGALPGRVEVSAVVRRFEHLELAVREVVLEFGVQSATRLDGALALASSDELRALVLALEPLNELPEVPAAREVNDQLDTVFRDRERTQ
jgi:hypothetical protein